MTQLSISCDQSDSRRAVVAGGGRAAVGCVVLGGILFGTAGTAQALGASGTTPLGVGGVRLLVGGMALLAVVVLQGKSPAAALRLWRSRAGILAGGCVAAYQVCFFAAIQQTGVALGTLVTVGTAPVLAGLLAWAALRHRPTRAWVVATALCIAGLCLLSGEGLRAGRPYGVLLALVAGLAIATFTVAAKQLMDQGVGSLDVLTGSFLLGGALLSPWMITQPLGWLVSPGGALLALYLGVATMALANSLMAYGLKRLAPGPVTTMTLTDPLTATALGFLVLGETLAAPALAGLALVLLGLLLQGFTSAKGPEPHDQPAPIVPL
ncbi:MAG: EamA family transporter [Dermatophilaceae bacterium]